MLTERSKSEVNLDGFQLNWRWKHPDKKKLLPEIKGNSILKNPSVDTLFSSKSVCHEPD
jgi:hypothetical protein